MAQSAFDGNLHLLQGSAVDRVRDMYFLRMSAHSELAATAAAVCEGYAFRKGPWGVCKAGLFRGKLKGPQTAVFVCTLGVPSPGFRCWSHSSDLPLSALLAFSRRLHLGIHLFIPFLCCHVLAFVRLLVVMTMCRRWRGSTGAATAT